MARILIGNIKGPKGATGARGSQWFYGTGITGTSVTATVFSGSGVAAALVGDYYLSTAEDNLGNVYRCTTAGAANTAKWVYAGNIRGAQGLRGIQGETGPMPALINNALTTVAGQAALDAAMGKTLQDGIDALNGKISHTLGTTGVCTMSSDHSETSQNVIKKNGLRCHITIDTTCELTPNNGWLSDAGITIPEGFRPATPVMVPCWIRGIQYHQSVTALISSSGKITIYAGSNTTVVKNISMRCEYLL